MQRVTTTVVALGFIMMALAGCTAEEDGPISIKSQPDDPKTGAYTFHANVDGETYTWDFGDGTKATGKTVDHVFGVTDGTFKVKVTTTEGGEATTHAPLTLTIGGGTAANTDASFLLEMEWDWVQVGEPVVFSGASSSDPDGDTLLFSWFCVRTGDIAIAQEGHAHGPGGVDFASGSANVIPINVVNGTLNGTSPQDIGDSMCDGLNGLNTFSTTSTVTGSFNRSGLYEVSMLAKDPVHPSKPATKMVYVTDGPRQVAQETLTYGGTIEQGVPAELDEVMEMAENMQHIETHSFPIKYPIKGVKASISHDGGDTEGELVDIQYQILKGSSSKFGPSADDYNAGDKALKPGDHTLKVFLRQGRNVAYTVTIEVFYETDPSNIFGDAH